MMLLLARAPAPRQIPQTFWETQMKRHLAIIAALIAATNQTTRAEGLALGAHIGTLGPGIEAAAYLTPNLTLRVIGSFIDANVHGQIDDIDYDADFNFTTLQAVIDLHAENSGWRLTAGFVHNDNEIDVTGEPANSTISVGGNEYPSALIGEFSGHAAFPEWATYIGIGYGRPVADDVGFSFTFDLGVMIQSAPDVSLAASGPLASNAQFQADLKEEEQDAQEVFDNLKLYPVIAIGICYQFW
jgi:hypothetical protein